MIELKNNQLVISFPEVHEHCTFSIDFQRTLRIPDDGKSYPLPPGLGRFSVAHVDDHSALLPDAWLKRGGVMLPIFATEAMWLSFNAPEVPGHDVSWPFVLKVAAGKINAVDGEPWSETLQPKRGAVSQNYLALPRQPWLDGFYAGPGLIRQFVGMQLGQGYTVEEQLTGAAEHGGLQLLAFPMKREEFMRRFPKQERTARAVMRVAAPMMPCAPLSAGAAPDMGLAPGGRMRQKIHKDPFGLAAWDTANSSRCFVHMCNAMVWKSITGQQPPHPAPTAADYSSAGLPWFEHVSDAPAKTDASWLDKVKSVVGLAKDKGETVLPENASATPSTVHTIVAPPSSQELGPDEVRDGSF